jgi:tetratricopeptide (TPR) repeat protein
MVPTFLQKEDIYLNHRFFVCSTGFIIIMACLVDSLILKFDKLKNIFKFILITVFVFYFSYCFSFSYKQAEKYKDYKSFWINAYQDSPDYYIACQNLAGIYMDAGLLDEAQYYIEKTISLKSTFKTLINYANFLIVLGNFDEAETALLGIEKDMKGSKDLIYYSLSEIYYRKEDYGKAQQYALKAYNIKPYNIDYCKQLIKIYDIMGHYEEETKIYEQLLNFDKKNEEYKNKIRELKEKRNNKENTNA